MLSNLNKKPYILKTTLEPNQIYSCFGIKIKVKEQVDTFSNKGNFSIHINNINLKALKSQSHNTITKDTPLFCYVQESNQTHIVKLQDSTTSINIQLNKNLPKDSNGNLIPIIPKLIFLSFIPFRDSKEANNSPSQKISLTADDINKNYINVDFKIPLKYLGEWQNIKTHKLQQIKSNKSKEIISIKFNGKTLQILEKGEAKQEFTFKAQSGDNGNKETMIEEGNYYIKANEVIEANIINNVNIDINQFNLGNKYIKLHKNTSDKNIADKNTSNNNTANKNTSNNKTSNNKTLKDDSSLLTKALNLVKIQSTAYTIHGGKSYGDNKGIDLATQDLAFFKALQKLTNKYKIELENANNEIRVEVGYESGWHDPVDNPQITLFMQSGGKEPSWASFGNTRGSSIHQGIDLFATDKKPVYACLDGEIAKVNSTNPNIKGVGMFVILKITDENQLKIFRSKRRDYALPYKNKGELSQDNSFDKDSTIIYMRYLHLSSVVVTENQKVKAGDVIGYSGTTGITDGTCGPHLHFEISSLYPSRGLSGRTNPAYYIKYKRPKSNPNENLSDDEILNENELQIQTARKNKGKIYD